MRANKPVLQPAAVLPPVTIVEVRAFERQAARAETGILPMQVYDVRRLCAMTRLAIAYAHEIAREEDDDAASPPSPTTWRDLELKRRSP